ncbi:MAG: cytochrome P450 [Roseiflexaceae bacterium]
MAISTPPNARPAPGPQGLPVIGNILDAQRDVLGMFLEAHRTYGDVARLDMLGTRMYLVSHPDYVKHILQDHNRNYPKSSLYQKLTPMLGNGLVTSEGEFWLRQRRLAQPAFHRQRIAGFAQVMTDLTGQMLDRWQQYANTQQAIDVSAEMMHLTLMIISKTMFGADLGEEADRIGKAVSTSIIEIDRRVLSFPEIPFWIPTPANRRFLDAQQVLDDVVQRMITNRRQSTNPAAQGDLLSMLIEAQDEATGERMSDQQLRDEVMTIFVAGHETTANALSWAWYLLSRNPAVRRKLKQELEQVLGGRTPTMADLPKLRYTAMVIEEAMRLYPPAWEIERQALADDTIGGYHIPAGTIVMLSPYVVHRHPQFWSNPEGFEPERFLPEHSEGRPRFAYFPFGGGPRQCIGNNFALMEAQLILAMVAQRFDLNLLPGHTPIPEPLITLRPGGGVWVHITT